MTQLRWILGALVVGFFLLTFSASAIIDYAWWNEMGQLDTWYSMALYRYAPRLAAAVLAFFIFRTAFLLGRRRARSMAEIIDVDPPNYSAANVLIAVFSLVIGAATVSPWTIVQYFGGHSTASASSWRDPLFGEPLSYYLFDLPFYIQSINGLMLLTFLGTVIYFVSSIPFGDKQIRIEVTKPLRFLGAALLIFWAVRLYFGRYELLTSQHGFLTGADYVDEKIRLPLQWVSIMALVASGVFVAMGRYWLALPGPIVAAILRVVVPGAVAAAYVKPNEISLEKPYIERHIAATLSAYGLDKGTREISFAAKADAKIDFAKHRQVLENVRLWDWQAFRDTVSQVQPLRPYTYRDIDVDRYNINGMVRQVMVAPRELDIEQLGDARNQWVNPNFVYTHGYGLVLADSNKINNNGLPQLYVQDAPPEVSTPSLKLTRPELYYGEITHEPVFVRTAQQEFDYPSGSDNVHTKYQGNRGIPVSGFGMRLLAAAAYGNPNIVLTSYLTGDSRMLIHRNVDDRLETLAGFVDWDQDPYLVMTKEGRLVWIVDGYLTSDAHPYSQYVSEGRFRSYNYIRNSVKATVDAYDGETNIYIVDPTDPVVRSYQNLFPKLFREGSQMPQEIREHLRFGEKMFEAQAFIYRTYHMRDPEAFYNKADLWDRARYVQKQGAGAQAMEPTFVLAALPGETQAEFLLVLPFSPRGKDNLIGYMAARNDPAHYGEIVFLQMPKQEVLLGPMQLEARIDQDQTISKDLNLWNQQGSQVLRGQTLVLPVDDTFLYVKPIYLQAANARMPQLKKVVLAMGGRIVYEDTYERALEVLAGGPAPQMRTEPESAGGTTEGKPAVAPQEDVNTRILERLRRLRIELDALESEIRKR
ncbi:UPF0182 protein [Bryobacterales bacterium F-183]|nr:UPF0182 protein [Bryobacterales bacterium F-183]